MANKAVMDKLSIYIPQDKMQLDLLGKLQKIAQRDDRSINYLVVRAIEQFVEREDHRGK